MTYADISERARAAWRTFEKPSGPRILLGDGTCGRAAGVADVAQAIRAELKKAHAKADIYGVGCIGMWWSGGGRVGLGLSGGDVGP